MLPSNSERIYFRKTYTKEMADEYCFLCGLPYSDRALTHPQKPNLAWLGKGIGFDPKSRGRYAVGEDDWYGCFPIVGTNLMFGNAERDPDPKKCAFSGIVCHEHCVKFAEQTIGRPIDVDTMVQLKQRSLAVQSREYRNQVFPWELAYENEGGTFFSSPLSEDGNSTRSRIRICLVKAGLSTNTSRTDEWYEDVFDDLLEQCRRATRALEDVMRRQRHALGRNVWSLHSVVSNVGNDLARAAADAYRVLDWEEEHGEAPSAPPLGVPPLGVPPQSVPPQGVPPLGVPPSTARLGCNKLRKQPCTSTPHCEWTKNRGCHERR